MADCKKVSEPGDGCRRKFTSQVTFRNHIVFIADVFLEEEFGLIVLTALQGIIQDYFRFVWNVRKFRNPVMGAEENLQASYFRKPPCLFLRMFFLEEEFGLVVLAALQGVVRFGGL